MRKLLRSMAVAAASLAVALPAVGQTPAPAPAQAPAPEAKLKIGDKAPEFALQGSDGKIHRLSDYKGKTVVLAWFPKAFTGGWTAECKSLRASGDSIRSFENVVPFAASVDDAETNKKFAEQVEADYVILADPEKKVATAYGVVNDQRPLAYRWTFYIGPDGRIIDLDQKVSPATAGEDVVKRLEALKIKKRSAGQ
jgi:peroxiredoxin Q/BCP